MAPGCPRSQVDDGFCKCITGPVAICSGHSGKELGWDISWSPPGGESNHTDRPSTPKTTVKVRCECLAEAPVHEIFNSQLWHVERWGNKSDSWWEMASSLPVTGRGLVWAVGMRINIFKFPPCSSVGKVWRAHSGSWMRSCPKWRILGIFRCCSQVTGEGSRILRDGLVLQLKWYGCCTSPSCCRDSWV